MSALRSGSVFFFILTNCLAGEETIICSTFGDRLQRLLHMTYYICHALLSVNAVQIRRPIIILQDSAVSGLISLRVSLHSASVSIEIKSTTYLNTCRRCTSTKQIITSQTKLQSWYYFLEIA